MFNMRVSGIINISLLLIFLYILLTKYNQGSCSGSGYDDPHIGSISRTENQMDPASVYSLVKEKSQLYRYSINVSCILDLERPKFGCTGTQG